MLIIIEGPDCAGKSSLVSRLEDEINRRYRGEQVLINHCGPPAGHPVDEYVVPLLGYRPGEGTHVICDRLHWGERVYPQIFGRESKMDPGVWRYVESFLLSRGAFVVHLTEHASVLRQRMEQRGDDLVQTSQLFEIKNAFHEVAAESLLVSRACKISTPDLVPNVIERARLTALNAEKLNPFVTYVGPTKPRKLLLGDVRGPMFQTGDPMDKIRTAFMPYPQTSGPYLWNTLAGAPDEYWRDYGIGVANACDGDDTYELWRALGQPNVTTMGQNAYSCFKGVASKAPHPQWVRRFHHKRVAGYRQTLLHGRAFTWS